MYPLRHSLRRARPAPRGAAPPAVRPDRYPEGVDPPPFADDAVAWAALAQDVPERWFARRPPSWLHGVRHTQRVHIHAQRLVHALDWPEADARIVLSAALWHDIGRVGDGCDPTHGASGVSRVRRRGLQHILCPAEATLALFAVRYHCRSDGHGLRRAAAQHDPERACRILSLLKDADALDRVRLGDGLYEIDSTTLRHPCTRDMMVFALELFEALP